MDNTMRVWIGCLGCYNAGALVGTWVDAVDADTVTVESLADLIRDPKSFDPERGAEILAEHLGTWHPAASPHEELWCMDQENLAPFIDGECSPAAAQSLAEAVDDMDDADRDGFGAYVADQGGLGTGNGGWADWAEARADWEDHRYGIYKDAVTFACDFYEEQADELSGPLAGYIDWQAVARDLLQDFGTAELSDGRLVVWTL